MKRKFTIAVLILLVLAVGGATACKSKPEIETLRFAVHPSEDAEQEILGMKPLLDHMEKELGMPVEAVVSHDYNACVEALRAGHAEIAWLGPFSYVLGTKLADIEAIIAGVREGGIFGSNSIIFTLADSGIEDIDDLKGRTFAFVDPGSTSGYLFPSVLFKERGIDPETDFASVTFAGSHHASALAVKNGTVDAAASNWPSYQELAARGEIDPEIQIIIWKSEDIPPSPIAIRSDLSDELKQEIVDAFVSSPASKGVGMKSFEAFREVKDADYDIIREIAETLGIEEEPP